MSELEATVKASDVFLISPVRIATPEDIKFMEGYVKEQESKGKIIYLPLRDTDQNDPVGLRICRDNREAIRKTKEVQVYYKENSQGTFFDLGMAWMNRKPITFIGNGIKTLDDAFDSLGLDCSQLKGRKLTEWAERERFILENSRTLKRCYKTPFGRGYEWIDNNPNLAVFLFDFGMAFMADAGIFLENNKQVERTPKKSFQNVLLELDAMYWDS